MEALEGVRVLHLSRTLPGHHCAMMLSDHGARVLAIEQPGYAARRARGAAITSVRPRLSNRNQRSMTLDLKSDEGKEILFKMVKDADAVLEGYRPGVTRRLGIDYATLEGINPRLVYCAMSGWGQDGPYRDIVGHDINFIAVAGILDMTGAAGAPPVIPGMVMADMGAALHAAIGILIALFAREKTGRGQFVDISYLDGVVSWFTSFPGFDFDRSEELQRGKIPTGGATPCYNVYQAKDGKFISVGCNEPWFWENLCKALGREDFIAHQNAEGEKREEIFSELRRIFLSKTRDEWFAFFTESGTDIACAPVNSVKEALHDPQVVHRMVRASEFPGSGRHEHFAPPVKLSNTPGSVKTPPPVIGQHTDEVLKELGYTSERIQQLRSAGVIE